MYEEDEYGAQPAEEKEDKEDDSVSASEEAFMRGYEDAGNEEEDPNDDNDSEEDGE